MSSESRSITSLIPQRLYRVGQGRAYRMITQGRQRDKNARQGRQQKRPWADINTVSERRQPLADAEIRHGAGEYRSDRHQLDEVYRYKLDHIGYGRTEYFPDADLFDMIGDRQRGQAEQTETGDQDGQCRCISYDLTPSFLRLILIGDIVIKERMEKRRLGCHQPPLFFEQRHRIGHSARSDLDQNSADAPLIFRMHRHDSRRRRNVCVIGPTVRDDLKFGEDVIGRTIRIDRHYFTVIGVLESRGQMMGADRDDTVLIPLTTASKLYGAQLPKRLTIMAQARTIDQIETATQQITAVLRKRHRLGGLIEDFKIFSQTEILDNVRQFSTMITAVVAGIVGIALFVGGIGIMNTMLASVAERSYEIGLRKSVGAQRKEIMHQFLIESIVLSAGGGLLGLLFGAVARYGFGLIIDLPVSFALWPLLLSFGFACTVGLFFGVYPAVRAADLDPIKALQWV